MVRSAKNVITSVRRYGAVCIAAALTSAAGASVVTIPGQIPVGPKFTLGLPVTSAGTVTLQDGNATVKIDTASAAGLFSFNVNGKEQASAQSFYYRLGQSGPDQPLSALTQTFHSTVQGDPPNPGPNLLTVDYAGSGFTVDVMYDLTGGSGTGAAQLAETIRINNTSTTTPLGIQFYEYDHFTPNNSTTGNTAMITDANTADVLGAQGSSDEVVVNPDADHFEVGLNGTVLSDLQNGNALNDLAGPVVGNPAFAFEWAPSIPANGTYLISKVKTVTPAVPLPPAVYSGLATLAGLGAITAVRRRIRMA